MQTTVDLTSVFAAHGLPEPVAEYKFLPDRRFRFDYAFPLYKVGFEREGGTWHGGRHTHGAGYARDCEKYNLAALDGWIVIRATSDQIRDGSAFDFVLRALGQRGWKGV